MMRVPEQASSLQNEIVATSKIRILPLFVVQVIRRIWQQETTDRIGILNDEERKPFWAAPTKYMSKKGPRVFRSGDSEMI